jgi:alkanesulfonate monooxygenase SsuD/methylene tetrahydromethanopterin reductase-like flavin-dependent oxidoreductase (luciferase family)
MRIDLVLPSESAADDPRALAELAVAAERHGFGAVWLPDHLLPPGGRNTTYGGVHEPLVTLVFLAARTTRLLLGTSVLITPLRESILLAKQTATLDALAPGRVLLGVGTGWERSEFIDRWRQPQPAHLAIWIGALAAAANRIAALGDALGREPP